MAKYDAWIDDEYNIEFELSSFKTCKKDCAPFYPMEKSMKYFNVVFDGIKYWFVNPNDGYGYVEYEMYDGNPAEIGWDNYEPYCSISGDEAKDSCEIAVARTLAYRFLGFDARQISTHRI